MTTRRLAALVLVLAAGSVRAQALSYGGYDLGSTISAGYRFVDVDGSNQKYRDDVNLQQGPRLFLFDVDGATQDDARTPVDRFHLVVATPGNEPVSSYHLDAADHGLWDFRANLVRSKYYYFVPELFENPVPGDVRTEDLHTFSDTRTNGTVDLRVTHPGLPTLFAGYRLSQLEGGNMSTVYVSGGDTFLISAPGDTRQQVGRVGTEFRALGTDVSVTEEYSHLSRTLGRHGPLPDEAQGVDPTDLSTLSLYDAVGSEQVNTPTTILRASHPFGDKVVLDGSWLTAHATLDSSWTIRQNATDDTGAPVTVRTQPDGHVTLDTNIADLGATYRVSDAVRLHATYRYDERVESGEVQNDGTTGTFPVGTGDQLRLNRVTVDAEYEPRRDLSLRAGVRTAWRYANVSTGVGPVSTTIIGGVADVRYRPVAMLDTFVHYETASLDDPYRSEGDPTGRPAIPGREIEFTLTNRGSTGFTLRPWQWMRLTYRFIGDVRENPSFDGKHQAYGNAMSLVLTPLATLSMSLSFARRDIDDHADILVAPTYLAQTSLQQGTEDVVLTQIGYDFGLFGQRWAAGGNLGWTNANETLRPGLTGPSYRTQFDINRVDGALFLTWKHRWVEPTVEVRRIDYTEPTLPANDYRATIVTLSLTKRFGTAAASQP